MLRCEQYYRFGEGGKLYLLTPPVLCCQETNEFQALYASGQLFRIAIETGTFWEPELSKPILQQQSHWLQAAGAYKH